MTSRKTHMEQSIPVAPAENATHRPISETQELLANTGSVPAELTSEALYAAYELMMAGVNEDPAATGDEPKYKLVLRNPKMNCTHDKAVEQTKNRFFCLDCGFEFKMVRQSVLRRRTMLR